MSTKVNKGKGSKPRNPNHTPKPSPNARNAAASPRSVASASNVRMEEKQSTSAMPPVEEELRDMVSPKHGPYVTDVNELEKQLKACREHCAKLDKHKYNVQTTLKDKTDKLKNLTERYQVDHSSTTTDNPTGLAITGPVETAHQYKHLRDKCWRSYIQALPSKHRKTAWLYTHDLLKKIVEFTARVYKECLLDICKLMDVLPDSPVQKHQEKGITEKTIPTQLSSAITLYLLEHSSEFNPNVIIKKLYPQTNSKGNKNKVGPGEPWNNAALYQFTTEAVKLLWTMGLQSPAILFQANSSESDTMIFPSLKQASTVLVIGEVLEFTSHTHSKESSTVPTTDDTQHRESSAIPITNDTQNKESSAVPVENPTTITPTAKKTTTSTTTIQLKEDDNHVITKTHTELQSPRKTSQRDKKPGAAQGKKQTQLKPKDKQGDDKQHKITPETKMRTEMLQLEEKVTMLYEEIESLETKLRTTQQHIDDHTTKIASQMNALVSTDESNLENIGIQNRPMNIASEYQLFCSQAWLEAKNELDDLSFNEQKSCDLLCQVLMAATMQAQIMYRAMLARIKQVLNNYQEKVTENPLPEALKVVIGDYLRSNASTIDILPLATKIEVHIPKELTGDFRKCNIKPNFKTYVVEAARIAWKMTLQRPPMTFRMNHVDKPWTECNQSVLEPAWGSSPVHVEAKLLYYVNPALYHGDKLMTKGKVLVHGKDEWSKIQYEDSIERNECCCIC